LADVKISQLPAATTPLAGDEEIPLVQSGVTKKTTVDDIVAAAGGAVTEVTATSPVVSSGGAAPNISIPAADGSTSGYLTSTDWNTFNSKGSGTVTGVTATSPVVSSGGAAPNISLPAANGSTNGYLTSTDWNTFNNKGSGTVTSVTGTAPIVSSGGATPAISIPAANGSTNGYLTSTDWNTFNNKQPAGSYLVSGGALGTPSSGTLTNTTGLPLTTGVTGILPVANGGSGTNTPSLVAGTNVSITGTWPNQTINASGGAGSGDVTGPASATDNAITRFDGTTGKIIQNSGVTLDDNNEIGNVNDIAFDTTPATVPTAPGSLYWDSADSNQTLSLVMAGGNAVQQIGEEIYYRVKASAAITNGQSVMVTGSVGASGGLLAAPASGLTANNGEHLIGVATEDIALNGWGYVTQFGLVRNIDTTGASVGETWVDGDVLYYNPSYTGGLTKTVPTAPTALVEVAEVVHANASSGSLFVRITLFPRLNQLANVYAPTPSDNDLLKWSNSNSRWETTPIKTVNSTSLIGSGNVAVQETLVSGTNIKTINSTSLLGSGDIATGDVTLAGTQTLTNKTISYASNTLTGVQAELVSGTNIKTVGGTSLLGSGDVPVVSTGKSIAMAMIFGF
jgi:hypothetical protein